jgi:hypothetical protein
MAKVELELEDARNMFKELVHLSPTFRASYICDEIGKTIYTAEQKASEPKYPRMVNGVFYETRPPVDIVQKRAVFKVVKISAHKGCYTVSLHNIQGLHIRDVLTNTRTGNQYVIANIFEETNNVDLFHYDTGSVDNGISLEDYFT